jgi:hypothetical protein
LVRVKYSISRESIKGNKFTEETEKKGGKIEQNMTEKTNVGE